MTAPSLTRPAHGVTRNGTPARRRRHRGVGFWARGVAVAAVVTFTLFPIYFMLSTALSKHALSGTDSLFPSQVTLEHFTTIFVEGNFGTYLMNSAIVTVATVVLSGALALLGAVAIARFRFRFRTTMLVLVLIVQMLPAEAL